MKKTLFSFLLLGSLLSYGQNCLTVSSTGFSTASTGLSSISLPDATTVWVSANSGNPVTNRTISLSTNGGVNFTPRTVTLNPGNVNIAISNVCGVSPTVAYIAGHGASGTLGGIWKTTDAGVTWAKQTTALYNTADSFPNFVHFWDANNGVTMGDPSAGSFEIYTTTDGGTNWVRTPSANIPAFITPAPPANYVEYGLTNQFTVTGNTIWLGTTFGNILKSTDKGLTWTKILTPVPGFSGGDGTPAPALYNANQSWKNDLVGTITDSNYNYWRTSNGGTTWVQDTNGIPRQFDFAYIPGTASTVICIGDDPIETTRGLHYSFDDGLTWTSCPDTAGSQGGIAAFRSASYGFVSGFTTSTVVGGIWRYTSNNLPTENFVSKDKFFSISQNPSNGKFSITGDNINSVEITSILGQVVLSNTFSSNTNIDIDISKYSSGIYMVKVTNDLGNSSVAKVIKQ